MYLRVSKCSGAFTPSTRRLFDGVAMPVPHGSTEPHWLISTQVTGAGSFFPETAWKLFIVNAPFVFKTAYKVIKPFIHPVTRDKIKILGGKSAYLPEMKKAGIPLSAIPVSMGGTCEDKSIERCIEQLLADGFPRAARDYVQQTEEVAEGEVVLTREPSLPGEEAEAETTLSPSTKILGVVGLAATAFGGAVASGAVF